MPSIKGVVSLGLAMPKLELFQFWALSSHVLNNPAPLADFGPLSVWVRALNTHSFASKRSPMDSLPPPISPPSEPKRASRGEGEITAAEAQTTYSAMAVEANEVSTKDNMLVAFWSWLTLAGFVLFPGTFTSLEQSGSFENNKAGKVVLHTIKNVPAIVIGCACCCTGLYFTVRVWLKLRKNHIWLLERIFWLVSLLLQNLPLTQAKIKTGRTLYSQLPRC